MEFPLWLNTQHKDTTIYKPHDSIPYASMFSWIEQNYVKFDLRCHKHPLRIILRKAALIALVTPLALYTDYYCPL